MKTFKKLVRFILKITIIPTAFGFIAFALFKESFLTGFISGLVIIGGFGICSILLDIYEWTFTEDKPKGYKDEGTPEIVSNPNEEKSQEDYRKSLNHPICKDCACYLWTSDECGYDKPTSVVGTTECLHPCK